MRCGEPGFGYPVGPPPVSVLIRREGYDYLRRRLRCAGLHSAWGIVEQRQIRPFAVVVTVEGLQGRNPAEPQKAAPQRDEPD